MHVRQVTMTPELAAKLLELQGPRRVLTPGRVNSIAASLTAGRFIPEASGPVVLGADNSLHDGQHRLHATVQSGVSWECILIEDAPAEARFFQDTGKRRTFADQLRIKGIAQNSLIAAVTRLLWFYDHGLLKTRSGFYHARASGGPDHMQLWEHYSSQSDQIQQALRIGRTLGQQGRQIMTRSTSCAGARILMDVSEDDCQDFFKQLGLSAEDGVSPQIATLIKSLANLPVAGTMGVRGDQQHQLALLFKGWNAWRDGDPVDSFRWKMGGSRPEAFPVPH